MLLSLGSYTDEWNKTDFRDRWTSMSVDLLKDAETVLWQKVFSVNDIGTIAHPYTKK